MEVQQDFRDLLALFNKNAVEYMIVGAYALGFHGAPRFTGDLDIFIKPDPENAQNILQSLHAFGFGSLGLKASDFMEEGRIVQLGFAPVRIDIITSITGVTWEQAQADRVKGPYGDLMVDYIGHDSLVANKRSLGRRKDLADLEAVGKA